MEIKHVGAGSQAAVVSVNSLERNLTPTSGEVQNRLDRALSPASVQPAKEMAQEISQPAISTLEFSIDAESDKVVVKIIDSTTQELVRQIPMEEMLALAKALGRLKGLLLNTKV
ncbi:flagellar protein FlaG [Nitrosospira sp. Nsp1]|uniref:flagellar protein FlaG n=1 Tax=Nitrosospira sp. Nsp1 TaxID=136547 RepID=UPI0008922CF8|nr:flagellar protein FlaG [Nitrosospira sp. Nsp1]SCX56846.1 flagellar protein FlaG [Nitrosospira sp. Nsp1]